MSYTIDVHCIEALSVHSLPICLSVSWSIHWFFLWFFHLMDPSLTCCLYHVLLIVPEKGVLRQDPFFWTPDTFFPRVSKRNVTLSHKKVYCVPKLAKNLASFYETARKFWIFLIHPIFSPSCFKKEECAMDERTNQHSPYRYRLADKKLELV